MTSGKISEKSIRRLIVLVAVLVLAVMYFEEIWMFVKTGAGIFTPFLIGGAMAFILNILMSKIERLIFSRTKRKIWQKLKRPVSLLLTITLVIMIIFFVITIVVPQIAKTMMTLRDRIPGFYNTAVVQIDDWLGQVSPDLQSGFQDLINLKLDWNEIYNNFSDLLQSGVSNVVLSTINIAGNIISVTMSSIIAIVFCIYILTQKEKLGSQFRRVFKAYLPEKVNRNLLDFLKRSSTNFGSFISGQCLEAVILGTMFVITMSVLQLPYAVMIGIVIAVTALIPLVGAFSGCVIGAFLILVDDPIKALTFIIMSIILQQIEGNLIYPHVVGSSVKLPSIWVLVALTVGGSLFGIVGMLVFIPLVSTFYAYLKEDVVRRETKDSEEIGVAEVTEQVVRAEE